MNKRNGLIFLILLTLFSLTGCDYAVNNQIAVVDLDKIAKQTGRTTDINKKIQQFIKEKEISLTQLRNDLQLKIKTERAKLSKKSSPKEKQNILTLTKKAGLQLRQTVSNAEREAKQLRLKYIQELRDDITPVAAKIANKQGMKMVMLKTASMMYVDDSVDITDMVITKLDMTASGE